MVGEVEQPFFPMVVLNVFDIFVKVRRDKVVIGVGSAFHMG